MKKLAILASALAMLATLGSGAEFAHFGCRPAPNPASGICPCRQTAYTVNCAAKSVCTVAAIQRGGFDGGSRGRQRADAARHDIRPMLHWRCSRPLTLQVNSPLPGRSWCISVAPEKRAT